MRLIKSSQATELPTRNVTDFQREKCVFFLVFSGEIEETRESQTTVLPGINQLKFPLPNVNQAAFQVNPVQSYTANQPYFNRFAGKGVKVLSNQRTTLTSVPSFMPRQFNTIHRYIGFSAVSNRDGKASNRPSLTSKGQIENPRSRQLANKKMIPAAASGVVPVSLIKSIPILKSYEGGRLVISRSNSYLLNKLFPSTKADSPRPNTNELQWRLNNLTTFRYPSSVYFKPASQSKLILTNSVTPSFPIEYYTDRDISHINEAGGMRDKLKTSLQTNAFPYKNQNNTTSRLARGYLKGGSVLSNSVRNGYSSAATVQALTNPYSDFKPRLTSVSTNNFQITRGSHSLPVISGGRSANNIGFQLPLTKVFFHHPFPWRKGRKTGSTEDKVVTEEELREKGLLGAIMSRNHIHYKKRWKIWPNRPL